MSKPFNLQCRTPKGPVPLKGIPSDTTFAQLKAMISEKTSIPVNRQRILAGYPPKDLIADDKATLTEMKLANGDTLNVTEGDPTHAPAAPASATPAPATASAAPTPAPASSSSKPAAVAPVATTAPPISKPAATASSHTAATTPTAAPGLAAGNADDGYVLRRVVDADNSCLFNSVGYVLENHSRNKSALLRKVIADAVAADPGTYTEAFLAKSNEAYRKWILNKDSWGGAIELAILAKHYKTEIAAFDIVSTRMDIYGQSDGYSQRVMVIYDGIHYDPLALSFDPSLPEELDQTIFNPKDTSVLDKAMKLCKEANQKRQFTNTAKFTLRCLVCQQGLEGEKAATDHARKTKHTNFAEY